jgi:hypothetical protein
VEVIFGCIKEMEECRDRLSRHALILTNVRRCCQDKNRVNSRGNILSCFFLWKLYLGKPRPVYDWTIGNPDGNYLNGHTLVDTCCAGILPKNDVMSVELPFSDSSGNSSFESFKSVMRLFHALQYLYIYASTYWWDWNQILRSESFQWTKRYYAYAKYCLFIKSIPSALFHVVYGNFNFVFFLYRTLHSKIHIIA